MWLLGGFFLFLFSKISVMLFIWLLFKFSIKLCLIELFSTAVWRLAGGFGSEWEERGGVRASKQNMPPRALPCPLHTAAHEEGQFLRGVYSAKRSVEISVSRKANKGYLYLSVSLSEILKYEHLSGFLAVLLSMQWRECMWNYAVLPTPHSLLLPLF